MTKIEVREVILAYRNFCNYLDRVKEGIQRWHAMGAFNMAEIMRDAQQAIDGDYEQLTD